MKRAVIGDIHGCIDELKELYSKLSHESLDEIWSLGDFVDRGPDSGAVVEFLRTHGIRGILGNHESMILPYRKKFCGDLPKDPEKNRTCHSIRSSLEWDYLDSLPPLHVFEDRQTVLVHGGLFPKLPLYRQPLQSIIRLQLIHPDIPNETHWFKADRDGTTEETFRAQGWKAWYELYDDVYDVIFGHSVFREPFVYAPPFSPGRAIGIDTGAVYGGKLTAVILNDERESFRFLQVPAKKAYTNPKDFL